MKDISAVVYRGFPKGRIVPGKGDELECRGDVSRLKGDSGAFSDAGRYELGLMAEPKWIFTGWMESPAQAGDILETGGNRFRVLECRQMKLGGTAVCMRAVLEPIAPEEPDGGEVGDESA